MTALSIQPTFPTFTGADGQPLENGYIWIGTANLNPITNPITVYWDAALSAPATQPIRTLGGYPSNSGTPARMYVNSDYSIQVLDRKGSVVYSAPVATERYGGGIINAADVVYDPAGTGAAATTVQTRLREAKSLLDNLTSALRACVSSGTYTTQQKTDLYTAIALQWTDAIANGWDLWAPAGTYDVGTNYFPWRQAGVPATLLDCNDVTIYCAGPNTIFKTSSVGGADVFQLNGIKNFHVKGFPTLTATISGSGSGSNGVSITNGFDNLTLEITGYNLPSLDKTTYVDGGAVLSVQLGTTGITAGKIIADVRAKGCSTAFSYQPDLVSSQSQPTSIDVNVVAEDCYKAFEIAAAEATGAMSAASTTGVVATVKSINCQRDVVLARAHGCTVSCNVVTTKTAAARRLNPSGVAWFAAGPTVDALLCTYAKNAQITVYGEKGACDYKAQIGAAAAGSSGLGGYSEYCDIYLDIGGSAGTADIYAVDSGGNTLNRSRISATAITGTIPSDFYTVAKYNQIQAIGSEGLNLLQGSIRFPETQVSSSNVNDLDDYEEGTFTAILADTGLAAEGATYSSNTGMYTKIGNRVTFNLYIALTGLGTLTGGDAAYILGLPYANLNTSANLSGLTISYAAGLALSAGEIATARVGAGDQYITLAKWPAAGTAGTSVMTIANVSASGVLVITGTYRAAT
jgi:hypothetical protein